jgi:hypothetical protein
LQRELRDAAYNAPAKATAHPFAQSSRTSHAICAKAGLNFSKKIKCLARPV